MKILTIIFASFAPFILLFLLFNICAFLVALGGVIETKYPKRKGMFEKLAEWWEKQLLKII